MQLRAPKEVALAGAVLTSLAVSPLLLSVSQTRRAVRTTEYRLLSGQVGKLAQDGKVCITVPVWYGFVLRQNLV